MGRFYYVQETQLALVAIGQAHGVCISRTGYEVIGYNMPSCSFFKCKNSSRTKNKAHGITFHSFPQDEPQRHQWILVVRKQRNEPEWIPTNHSRICSTHFRSEDIYNTNKGYKRISKSAIPFFQVAYEANYSPSRASPNSTNNVDVSQYVESVIEPPRIHYVKKKLHKATMRNRRLMLENKYLKKRNKRLINTCQILKETLALLKRKVNESENCSILSASETELPEKQLKTEIYLKTENKTIKTETSLKTEAVEVKVSTNDPV